MIPERFIIPAITAAAVHAAFFAILPPTPDVFLAPAEPPRTYIEIPPLPPLHEPPRAPASASSGGGGENVASLEEPPVPPRPSPFTIVPPQVVSSSERFVPNKIPPVLASGEQGPGPAGPPGEPIFDVVGLDREPRARVQISPEYPFEAKRTGLNGEVLVTFVVGADGAVRDARVVRSDHREFENAALRAVMKWRFEPGRVKGRPVSFRMSVPLVFRLEDN